MKELELELVDTKEGIHTLYNKRMHEHYHSMFGSMQESINVFIKNGLLPVAKKYDEIRILEIGFGTGLNAILTYRENQVLQKQIQYTTVEINQLPMNVVNRLNYFEYFGTALQPVFMKMHKCKWFEKINLSNGGNNSFEIYKMQQDVLECSFDDSYDLVYFDVFSPAHQPELWQYELFKKIYDSCNNGALLVSYCSRADVRRTLEAAGFEVEKTEGPKGKREMIRALK